MPELNITLKKEALKTHGFQPAALLDEGEVAPVGHRGNSDDREGARLGGDDGKADAPPGDIFTAQKLFISTNRKQLTLPLSCERTAKVGVYSVIKV